MVLLLDVLAKCLHLGKVSLLVAGQNPQRVIPLVGVDHEFLVAKRELSADILNGPEKATSAGK